MIIADFPSNHGTFVKPKPNPFFSAPNSAGVWRVHMFLRGVYYGVGRDSPCSFLLLFALIDCGCGKYL